MVLINFEVIFQVERIQSKIKRENRCLYLPTLPIQCYLKKLRSADFNMFDPLLQHRDHLLSLKLLYRRFIS